MGKDYLGELEEHIVTTVGIPGEDAYGFAPLVMSLRTIDVMANRRRF